MAAFKQQLFLTWHNYTQKNKNSIILFPFFNLVFLVSCVALLYYTASAERPVTIIPLTIGLSVTGKKPVSANWF